ncbi:MAG: TIR domain-containing protein [Magnetococcales bacterium]|nr:TIR domain-containing protein [Magnetococcales bacterium]
MSLPTATSVSQNLFLSRGRIVESQPEEPKKYWSFISYSHQDHKWAEWLHRSLESYRVPSQLVGKITPQGPVPKRIFPIFRDREELPGSASLGDKLNLALENSRSLVVICSPNSAISHWVNQEVKNYKALGNFHRVFCLIVAGEPGASAKPDSGLLECFPEAIRYHVDMDCQVTNVPAEPIAADARPGKDGKRDALIKLLAGILDVDYDALKQREKRRRVWRIFRWTLLVATIIAALTSVWYDGYQDRIAAEAAKNHRFADLLLKKSKAAIKSGRDGVAMFYGAHALKHRLLSGEKPNPRESDFLASLEMEAPQIATYRSEEEVMAVAFEPNGVHFVSGSDSGRLTIWNSNKTRPGKSWQGHDGSISAIIFSPQGEQLLTAGADGKIRFWSFPKQTSSRTEITTNSPITAMALSHDNRYLAVATLDRKLIIWDLVENRILKSQDFQQRLNALLFTRQGRAIIAGGDDRTLWRLNLKTAEKKPLQPLKKFNEPIRSLATSPDGNYLAIGSWDTTIYIWHVQDNKKVAELDGHDKSVEGLAFHPSGNRLASVSLDETVRLWETGSWQALTTLPGHGHNVTSLAFDQVGKLLITGSRDRSIRLWQVKAEKTLALLQGHTATVRAVAFHPSDNILVSAGDDMTIRSWNLETMKELFTFKQDGNKEAHDDTVRGVAFHPMGKILASVGRDRAIRVWDVSNGEMVAQRENAHDHWIFATAFSPDGKTLATSSYDGIIKLWSIPSLQELFSIDGHNSKPVGGVAFSPDGTILASASDDMTVGLYSSSDGSDLGKLRGHSHVVRSLLFSPDGKNLYSSSADSSIHIWDMATKTVKKRLMGHHQRMVWSLALGANGRWLVSGSHSDDRQTLRLWDLINGRLKARLPGHKDFAVTTAISTGKELIASGGTDNMVRLWSLDKITAVDGENGAATDFINQSLRVKNLKTAKVETLLKRLGKMTNQELIGSDAMPIVQPKARAGTNAATRF